MTATSTTTRPGDDHVAMPPLRDMSLSILRQALESTIVPTGIFWVLLHVTGLVPALLAALGWCYAMVGRRWYRGHTFPTVLLVGTLLFTTRTGVALAFHSAFVYLLTPVVSAFAVSLAFLVSIVVGRPLTERFARDFVGLTDEVVRLTRVERALKQLAVVWAGVGLVNGGVALALLLGGHVDGVLAIRAVLGPLLTISAVGACVVLARRALKAEGIHLHLRWSDPLPA